MTALTHPPQAAMAQLTEAARVRLAADPLASAEALRDLAADPCVTVRATLAMNPVAAEQIGGAIAQDPDDRVRALLAQRLALLLPTLTPRHLATLQDRALATLMTLAADETVRVRAAIAEAVKDMSDVPRALILQLAADRAVRVSEPVIRLSPLLSTADLLALVASPPHAHTVTSVARRPALTGSVADAIAGCADPAAIALLIANPTAAISETTLDRLIARAVDHTDWHLPLVRRQHLSIPGLRMLADIVTGEMLREFAARIDLSSALAETIAARIAAGHAAEPDGAAEDTVAPNLKQALRIARDMATVRSLTEESVLAAVRRGEARMCTAMLAVAAGVAAHVVERAVTLRSTKGLVSLIWKGGFTMRAAGPLQALLVKLPPQSLLLPSETGGFPLSEDEMRWQLEFLMRIGRSGPQVR